MRDVKTIIPPAFEIEDRAKLLRASARIARERAARELQRAEELERAAALCDSQLGVVR